MKKLYHSCDGIRKCSKNWVCCIIELLYDTGFGIFGVNKTLLIVKERTKIDIAPAVQSCSSKYILYILQAYYRPPSFTMILLY